MIRNTVKIDTWIHWNRQFDAQAYITCPEIRIAMSAHGSMNFRWEPATSSWLICVCVSLCFKSVRLYLFSSRISFASCRWNCTSVRQTSPLCTPEKCFSPIMYGLYHLCLSVIGFIVLINDWHFISSWCPQCRRPFRVILCGLMVKSVSRVSVRLLYSQWIFLHHRAVVHVQCSVANECAANIHT